MSGTPVYLDIQIKARSNRCKPSGAGTFAAFEVRKPRPIFFFIFYSEQADSYWVLPSTELISEANQNKTGKHRGKYKIVFTNASRKTGRVKPRPRFEKYKDNFNLLNDYAG